VFLLSKDILKSSYLSSVNQMTTSHPTSILAFCAILITWSKTIRWVNICCQV